MTVPILVIMIMFIFLIGVILILLPIMAENLRVHKGSELLYGVLEMMAVGTERVVIA